MSGKNLLLVGDSEHDANMLYAVGAFLSDSCIFIRSQSKQYLVLNGMEIPRVKSKARHCELISLDDCVQHLRHKGLRTPSAADIIQHVLSKLKISKVSVPDNFPLSLARELQEAKLKLTLRRGSFFPKRETKNTEEVKKISAALIMAEVGLSEAIQVLRISKIDRSRRLRYHDVPLTAEKLRSVIQVAVLQAGGTAAHTVVSCGRQSCDPHEEGHGVLKANRPIVIHIFPRSQKTGYYGDIARTVVKGRAREELRLLYNNVLQAHELALSKLNPAVQACHVHQAVESLFLSQGHKTSQVNGTMEGFVQELGHGLGLETHEPPFLNSASKEILQAGQVVTIQPALYYPSIGGVRLEDVALLTSNGPRNLTKFEKVLEI